MYASQDHESLWEYLHGELNAADPERFPRPSDPNARTFETSFTSLSGKVSIILDEANNLESIEAGTLDAFLNILRKLRHCRSNTSSGLGALVMVGTEDLLSTLKKNNQSSPLDHVSFALAVHLHCMSSKLISSTAVLGIEVSRLTIVYTGFSSELNFNVQVQED